MQSASTQLSPITSQCLAADTEFDLQLTLVAGGAGLGRRITRPQVQRAGLPLAGLVSAVTPERLQILGYSEVQYLATLSPAAQEPALARLLAVAVPALIVTRGQVPPAPLLATALP